MKTIIVLARVDSTGPVYTGNPTARVCVYSTDIGRIGEAKRFARTEGYQVFMLPDTQDVLKVAREKVLKAYLNRAETRETIRRKLPGFKQETLILSQRTGDDSAYRKTLTHCLEFRGCFDELISLNYYIVQSTQPGHCFSSPYLSTKNFSEALDFYIDL